MVEHDWRGVLDRVFPKETSPGGKKDLPSELSGYLQ